MKFFLVILLVFFLVVCVVEEFDFEVNMKNMGLVYKNLVCVMSFEVFNILIDEFIYLLEKVWIVDFK